jgi:hypothetical protein
MKVAGKKNSEKPSVVFSSADFWLDQYQEMFSDFDPAPFERRTISQDFIGAVTRRFPEGSEEEICLRISVPKTERSTKTEAVIVRRLKAYFGKIADRHEKSLHADQKRGGIYFVAGCILLLAFVWVGLNMESVISQLLGVVFLPLGWFGVWEGTSRILSAPERYQKKLSLYKELAKAKYEFFSEEELLRRIKKSEKERK